MTVKITQQQLNGKFFAILQLEVKPTYSRWSEKERKMYMGRFRDKTFEVYSRDLKTWVQTPFNKSDGWRGQYMRHLILDKKYAFAKVWDVEKKVLVDCESREVLVPLSPSVEKQILERVEEEKRRGTNPNHIYFEFAKEDKPGFGQGYVYQVKFGKMMSNEDIQYVSSGAEAKAEQPKVETKEYNEQAVKEMAAAILFTFGNYNPGAEVDNYKGTLLNQINYHLKSKNISGITAEEVFENYLRKR